MTKAKKARSARTVRTPKKGALVNGHSDAVKARALKAYADIGTVKGATAAAKVSRRSWYDWIERDPAFGARVLELTEEVTDDLEAEAVKRAKEGSDTLLIFLLKSKRPQQYRERQEITVVSPDVKARLARQAVIMVEVLGAEMAEALFARLDDVWA